MASGNTCMNINFQIIKMQMEKYLCLLAFLLDQYHEEYLQEEMMHLRATRKPISIHSL